MRWLRPTRCATAIAICALTFLPGVVALGQDSRTIVLEGELSRDDSERLLERTFNVPAGTRHLEIELSYTGVDERTVVDLGLRGPSGIRGWSGGGPQTINVGATRASFGYLPGPIEPGEWAVILGIPNVRPGRRDSYAVRVRLRTDDDPPAVTLRETAAWYVGDLHTHSGHSDGRATTRAGTRVPVPAHRVFDAARAAGLDFVALTDHNTASHWLDVDRLQPYYDNLLLLHAREITTYRGHANAIGERRFHDFRLGPRSRASDALAGPAADGAFISINHPALPDDERCLGCGWKDVDRETLSLVNGVEVVNGPSITGPQSGWRFWADLLNRGLHLTAVGGSDEHAPDGSDARLGRPATVVCAAALSEPALVAGLKSGRVYVRTNGPEGPDLEFWAEADGRRYEMGDTIPGARRITLRAALGRAAGQELAWIKNGQTLTAAAVPAAGRLDRQVDAVAGDWFTVVVRNGEGPTLFANAIYVGP